MAGGYNPYPGKAAGGKTQKKATAAARAFSQSTAGKIQTEVGKQLVYAPLYLVPGGSSVRGATLAVKAARAANISVPKQLGVMARNTGRALNVSKSAGAEAVRAGRASGIPARVTLKQMAGVTAKNYGISRSSAGAVKGLQTSPGKGVASPRLSTKRKVAGAAVATGAAAYGLSRIPTSSAAPRQKYSGMKPGAERVRTGPGGAYVGSGMGAKARPQTGGSYVGSTVGGNTGSRKAPSTPSRPSTGGGSGQPRQAGPSKKQVQARRAAITDLLSKAEAAAAAGNTAAAANFSAAALNRQKAGQGSAASMQRMKKVARTYSKAAGRTKVENRMSGRSLVGRG